MKMHAGIKHLKCQHCDYQTASGQELRMHEATHSKTERPLSCHICQKTFQWKWSLRTHMVTHQELNVERPKCPFCDATFSLKQSIKIHIKQKHREMAKDKDDATSVKCELCDYWSIHKENMRDHKWRVHSKNKVKVMNHACPVCEKKFETINQLKSHATEHSELDEKSF